MKLCRGKPGGKIGEKLIDPCFTQERDEKMKKIVENIDCNFMQKRVL